MSTCNVRVVNNNGSISVTKIRTRRHGDNIWEFSLFTKELHPLDFLVKNSPSFSSHSFFPEVVENSIFYEFKNKKSNKKTTVIFAVKCKDTSEDIEILDGVIEEHNNEIRVHIIRDPDYSVKFKGKYNWKTVKSNKKVKYYDWDK